MKPSYLLLRLTWQTVLTLVLMGLTLFWAAGDLRWPQAWAYLILFLVNSAAFGIWLVRRDPGLLAARLSPPLQHGQPPGDRIFFALAIPLWFGWLVLMGLDARRWQMSHIPPWLNGLGGLLTVIGFVAICRVFAENSFAAPVVRLQAERGQRVIDTGPYALVRHPMYAAAIFYLAGMPLLLGSWAGLAVVPLILLGLSPRVLMEEKMLTRELAGYASYKTRVRWRLIPGIW